MPPYAKVMRQFCFRYPQEAFRVPPTEEAIAQVEAEVRCRLPADYRAFLLAFGGVCFKDDVISRGADGEDTAVDCFYGFYRPRPGKRGNQFDLLTRIRMYRGRMPDHIIPIGESGVNQLCLSLSGEDAGRIFVSDHEEETDPPAYENMEFVAPDFAAFMTSLALEKKA